MRIIQHTKGRAFRIFASLRICDQFIECENAIPLNDENIFLHLSTNHESERKRRKKSIHNKFKKIRKEITALLMERKTVKSHKVKTTLVS
jgi:hypothetical protein